jgi:hypothetical protein
MLTEKGFYRTSYKTRKEYDSITSKKCKCGHIISFATWKHNNVCNWCGRINFPNKKAEYDYYIKRRYGK